MNHIEAADVVMENITEEWALSIARAAIEELLEREPELMTMIPIEEADL